LSLSGYNCLFSAWDKEISVHSILLQEVNFGSIFHPIISIEVYMTKYKGLIFDLDGVIANTAQYHFQAWQKLAHAIGGHLSPSQYKKLKGVSRMESLDLILLWNSIGLNPEHKNILAKRKNQLYQHLISDLQPSDTLPGVVPFIQEAKAMGFQIGLGSASTNAKTVLEALELTSLFDVMVDGTQTDLSKPDPQVFTKGAEQMELHPQEIIVFEDGIRGIEAALAGGFTAVGVGAEEDLPKAHLVIPGWRDQDLMELIAQLG